LHDDSEEDVATAADPFPEVAHEAQTTGASPSLRRPRTDTGATLEAQSTADSGTMRRRLKSGIGQIIADAHTQDFEKKRKPGGGDSENAANRRKDGEDEETGEQIGSSDDEDESESEEDIMRVLDAEGLMRERRGSNKGAEDNRER